MEAGLRTLLRMPDEARRSPEKVARPQIVSLADSALGSVETRPGSSSPSPPGETAAWQAWLDAEGPGLLLYARQQTRHEADARDVFQEALAECWQRSGRRVAGAAPTGFDGEAEAADTRAFVEKAVRNLPPHLREVLVLRHWNGLSFPEIARVTDVPVATATSRHRYTLDRLRGILKKELQP